MTGPSSLLAWIASFGLDGSDEESRVPEPVEWDAIHGSLGFERLTGMAALLAGRGHLILEPAAVEALAAIDAEWAHHTLRADDVLLEVSDQLDSLSVPFRVLKGPSVAELHWRWGEARRWVDADVLVPADRFDEVVEALIAQGAQRPVPQIRPGFDRRFGKSVTLRSSAGPEIDLHRTLGLGPHTFLVDQADLWSEPRWFEVDGRRLSTMSPEATLVHLCMHATVGGSARLGSLRDVVEAAEGSDLGRAEEIAARWKVRASVRAAGAEVEERMALGDGRFTRWTRTLHPTAEETRIAAAYRSRSFTGRNLAVVGLRFVPGIRMKVAYSLAYILPSGENRRVRGRSLRDQIRAAAPRRRR